MRAGRWLLRHSIPRQPRPVSHGRSRRAGSRAPRLTTSDVSRDLAVYKDVLSRQTPFHILEAR